MPLSTVKNRSRERFNEVLLNLAFIESIEPSAEPPIHVKIQRGLYYVHLYSALEKVVNETVEQALLVIGSYSIPNHKFQTKFNVIALNGKMTAFKNCGSREYFNKSIDIFEAVNSTEVTNINNAVLSGTLQNVWFSTIQTTLESFCIAPLTVPPRVRLTVDEVVDKRNAVAHGRETPVVVGERFRCQVLRTKTTEVQLVSDMFVDAFENYLRNAEFVKQEHRPDYVA
ncbi:HEPN domain-containing protein [Vibrio harveyi]|uniref:HEPN domain-containing protein n=1 Tax=Vibrio harveyi TaxID=669 RepID=UPI00240DBEC6|nr:MAE_28990/MAE_18760 family HEPN-like nuclease [Vibrio harveyi]